MRACVCDYLCWVCFRHAGCNLANAIIFIVIGIDSLIFHLSVFSTSLLLHCPMNVHLVRSVYVFMIHSADKRCRLYVGLTGSMPAYFFLPLFSPAPWFRAPIVVFGA